MKQCIKQVDGSVIAQEQLFFCINTCASSATERHLAPKFCCNNPQTFPWRTGL